jgi:hypothetical protein
MSFGITQAKSIFSSKVFWGSIISLVSVISPSFYQHVLSLIGVSDPNVLAAKIVGGIGVALAIYGRFAATQPVTLTGGPVPVALDPGQKVPAILPIIAIPIEVPPKTPGIVTQAGMLEVTTRFVPTVPTDLKSSQTTDVIGELPKR